MKQKYGKNLCFWEELVSSTLPYKTPDDVKKK